MNLGCLGEIGLLYERAECAIKQYERIALEERAEVLDYLRGATHAIWNVLKESEGSKEASSALKESKESCERAIVAAREGVVSYLMVEVDSFWHRKFSKTELEKFFPQYREVFSRCGEIRKRWHDDAGRHAISLDQMESDFETLKQIRKEMDCVLPNLLAAKFAREESVCARRQSRYDAVNKNKLRSIRCESRTNAAVDWVAIALSVFGVVLTIVQEHQHRVGMVLMLCFLIGTLFVFKKVLKRCKARCPRF